MSWNYRVARGFAGGEPYYGIVEVYYDETGEVTGWSGFIDNPNGWDDVDELKITLKLMLKAFDRPIFEEIIE